MAGPRAPIGTLSQHSKTAAKLAREKPAKAITSRKIQPKHEVKAGDSSSDSSSDTDSSSDNDSDGDTKVEANWTSKLKAPKAAASAKTNGKAAQNHKTNSAGRKVVETSSDSESESSSESDSSVVKSEKIVKAEPESESDSDGEESSSSDELEPASLKTAKPTSKAANEPAKESESSSGDTSDGSSDSDSDAGAKVNTKTERATKQESSSSSEESESEVDSESESDSEDEKKAAVKPKVAEKTEKLEAKTKPKAAEKTEKVATPAPAKKLTKAAPAPAKKAPDVAKGAFKSSEMVVDSGDSPSEGGGSDVESSSDESEEKANQSMAVEKRNGKTAFQQVPEIISENFQLRKAGGMDASDVAQIFRDAKSKGKQIWYFTVPAALPIEVIQEQAIPLSTMAAAKAVISHRGSSYTTGAFDDATDTSITVLIPSKTGNKYETLNRPIDRAVHIKRVTRFSQDGDGESAAWTATSTGKSKPPRAQPKGLKARYQPLGVPSNVSMGGNIRMTTSSSGDEDEDVEMAQAPPASSSGTNVTSVTPKVGNKRKHGAVEIGTPGQEVTTSVSTKKVKKARFDTSEAPPSTPKAGKKGVKQTPVAPPLVPGLNGATSSSSALAMRSSNSKTPAGEKRALKKETPVPPPAVPGMNNP